MAQNLNYHAGSGCWCYDNSSNCEKYGRLYTWETANKVCPNGWHLPNKREWEVLLLNLGGEGQPAYKKIVKGGAYGFDALFAGLYYRYGQHLGSEANFWSSTPIGRSSAWYCFIGYDSANLANPDGQFYGFSVRCIRDTK